MLIGVKIVTKEDVYEEFEKADMMIKEKKTDKEMKEEKDLLMKAVNQRLRRSSIDYFRLY